MGPFLFHALACILTCDGGRGEVIGTWILTVLATLIWGAFVVAGSGGASKDRYWPLHAPYYLHTPLVALGLTILAAGLTLWIGPRRKAVGVAGRTVLVISLLLVLPYACFYTGGM